MDRNAPPHRQKRRHPTVATREGGVDRNQSVYVIVSTLPVATREGGVDRNVLSAGLRPESGRSPPARVAWIETPLCCRWTIIIYVATREGGVDRNIQYAVNPRMTRASPPARVAWIETCNDFNQLAVVVASPPARVAWIETSAIQAVYFGILCRHPRGWRG